MPGFYSIQNRNQAQAFSRETIGHNEEMSVASVLRQFLGKKRGDVTAFAANVGVSPGHINNVLRGRRLPASAVLLEWTDQIPAELRDQWREACAAAHVPERALEQIENLRHAHQTALATIADKEREITSLRDKIAALEQRGAARPTTDDDAPDEFTALGASISDEDDEQNHTDISKQIAALERDEHLRRRRERAHGRDLTPQKVDQRADA